METKATQIEKEEIKLFLLVGDMIFYLEGPKDSTKKLLEFVMESRKFVGYKTKTQKWHFYTITLLYTNNILFYSIPYTNNSVKHFLYTNNILGEKEHIKICHIQLEKIYTLGYI